jgi:tetratricopeptide (TPR) repeat protein
MSQLSDAETLLQSSHKGPQRIDALRNLAAALIANFEESGSVSKLERAISLSRIVISSGGETLSTLHNLAVALRFRFEYAGGSLGDMDEVFQLLHRCVQLSTDDDTRALIATHLAISYIKRYEQTQAENDLNNAITKAREALALTRGNDPRTANRRGNLAGMLLQRFSASQLKQDLDEIILLTQPSATADLADLANFAVALHTRFQIEGRVTDLERAISTFRQALELEDPVGRNAALNGLADSLRAKFERFGSTEDLDQAIEAIDAAVSITSKTDVNLAAFLINQGGVLSARAERNRSLEDNERSIESFQKAISLMSKQNPNRPAALHNLAASLGFHFQMTGSLADLDKAIRTQEEALSALPQNHIERGEMLDCYGSLTKDLFLITKSPNDLDLAIVRGQEAVDVTLPGHSKLAIRQTNLAIELKHRFELTACKDDFNRAVAYFIAALDDTAAPPLTRILAASSAAKLLLQSNKMKARSLLESAVNLLPAICPRTLLRQDQQYNLAKCMGITALAVSLSIDCGEDPYEALSISESGRCVLANLQLEVRSDLSQLREAHQELASAFLEVRNKIDDQTLTSGRCALYDQLRNILEEIRTKPGFGRFLLAPEKSELTKLAEQGPLVVVNVSEIRSDAILIDTTGIRTIELPITEHELVKRAETFLEVLRSAGKLRGYENNRIKLLELLEWLWEKCIAPILQCFGFTKTPSSKIWPRIWWVGSGLFNMLPVHAAGFHGQDGQTVIDRVIFSYIPTLKSLVYARSILARNTGRSVQKAMLIGMPKTPKLPSLPGVEEEIQKLQLLFPKNIELQVVTSPNRLEVLSSLRDSQVVHFCCHGFTSSLDPSRSHLALQDWKTSPLTVWDLTQLKLNSPQLAYLSACHTARVKHIQLLDESINLTSAVHLAGYPSVVGTLWSVSDKYASDIAETVYSWILSRNEFDVYRAAEGLHKATRSLRERTKQISSKDSGDPLIWAPYIYLGA